MVSNSSGRGFSSAPRHSEPDNLTWYSRFAVWIGALVLLVQSVTDRGPGFMTLLAVMSLTIGFVLFLAGLAWSGWRYGRPGARPVPRPDSEIPRAVVQSSDGSEPDRIPVREAALDEAQPDMIAERDASAERGA